MTREESAFAATLMKGQKLLDEMLTKALAAAAAASAGNSSSSSTSSQAVLAGAEAFLLYDSFGFPLELTQELAEAQGVVLDEEGFEAAMAAQRARSSSSRWAMTTMLLLAVGRTATRHKVTVSCPAHITLQFSQLLTATCLDMPRDRRHHVIIIILACAATHRHAAPSQLPCRQQHVLPGKLPVIVMLLCVCASE
jgi:hypothetical protein